MSYSKGFNMLSKDIRKHKVLSPETEAELIKKGQNGCKASRDKVINSNLRYVITVARKYGMHKIPVEDLISEGVIGMLKAFDKFDVSRGFKFLTFAKWDIHVKIAEYVHIQKGCVRFPLSAWYDEKKYEKFCKEYYSAHDEMPSEEVAVAGAGISERVHKLSFETTDAEDSRQLTADEKQYTYREEIEAALMSLPVRSIRIVSLYFGLDTGFPERMATIAERVGLSEVRVSFIIKEALAILKTKNILQ